MLKWPILLKKRGRKMKKIFSIELSMRDSNILLDISNLIKKKEKDRVLLFMSFKRNLPTRGYTLSFDGRFSATIIKGTIERIEELMKEDIRFVHNSSLLQKLTSLEPPEELLLGIDGRDNRNLELDDNGLCLLVTIFRRPDFNFGTPPIDSAYFRVLVELVNQ